MSRPVDKARGNGAILILGLEIRSLLGLGFRVRV